MKSRIVFVKVSFKFRLKMISSRKFARSARLSLHRFKKENEMSTPATLPTLPTPVQPFRCGRCFAIFQSVSTAMECQCWSKCLHCGRTHDNRYSGHLHENICLAACGMPQSGFRLAYVRFGIAYFQSTVDLGRWVYVNLCKRGLAPMSTTTAKVAAVWSTLLDFLTPHDFERTDTPHAERIRRACGDLLLQPEDAPFSGFADPYRRPEQWEPNTVSYPTNYNR